MSTDSNYIRTDILPLYHGSFHNVNINLSVLDLSSLFGKPLEHMSYLYYHFAGPVSHINLRTISYPFCEVPSLIQIWSAYSDSESCSSDFIYWLRGILP